MRRILTVLFVALVSVALVACEASGDGKSKTSQESEADRRQDSYDRLTEAQPARIMEHSPTRDRVNFWVDTWDEPDKLSFVYLLGSNGQLVGYYVFKGLPVTYCAALTPTYERLQIDGGEFGMDAIVPAPSVDGVYYSGGQCNQFYGEDATTGTYIEFTVGGSLNFLVYEEPLPRQDVEPLGFTEISDVQ